LAKLKLLLEGKLVQSLNLKLLAGMKVDSSLVRLEFLLGKGEIGSLAKLKFLPEQEVIEALVSLELKYAEGRRSPQVGLPMFLLQIPDEE
jgi:hypothetical protein